MSLKVNEKWQELKQITIEVKNIEEVIKNECNNANKIPTEPSENDKSESKSSNPSLSSLICSSEDKKLKEIVKQIIYETTK